MKYRIKQVLYADGNIVYYPQYKKYFRWKYFIRNRSIRCGYIDVREANRQIEAKVKSEKAKTRVKTNYLTYNPDNI